MKSKFLIPLLAVIFTTAMSFTTARTSANPTEDFVFTSGSWHAIPEMSCDNQNQSCLVRVLSDNTNYPIYDSQNFSDPKPGSGDVVGEVTLD
ncbi:DUF6520 family protein [Mesonia aquimarina]|uniref:DUF6520 family protein n=1 Tax=Mesonia aquimarina TaxID=1504967 RepID=UPI000EF56613|nr:DUF6520 family protein [Mesonia aquimarina]